MHEKKIKSDFNVKRIQGMLKTEYKFINDLFELAGVPDREDHLDDVEFEQSEGAPKQAPRAKQVKQRAQTMHELEERLKSAMPKKTLTYKERLEKKHMKSQKIKQKKVVKRLKQKQEEGSRSAALKLERAALKAEQNDENNEKNVNASLAFSKVEFPHSERPKQKKQEKNPAKILDKIMKHKEKLEQLEKSGETHKVVAISEKKAWNSALAKAEGEKVRDDSLLLKKSVKKREQKVRSSKKKWEARLEGVEKAKLERQKKRTENIQKKKKEKKVKKLKTAAKRGRIIPGY